MNDMARKISLLVLLCFLFLTGCVPVDCLNPLYTDSNVIFEPALLGKWAGAEPDESVRIERADNNAYQIILTEKKDSSTMQETVYEAHLVSLGGEKYLDLVPKQFPGSSNDILFTMDSAKKGSRFAPRLEKIAEGLYLEVLGPTPGKGTAQELHVKLRPVHWIFKVEQHEKSLSLYHLDDTWIRDAIRKKTIQAQYAKARDNATTAYVLTGSTADLQALVVHTVDDPGAFVEGMALRKVE
jgi:hypothetical protein